MKFNRTTAAATTMIAVIALVIGFFVVTGTGDDAGADDPTAPAEASTDQSLTVSARDTSKRALSGVAVRLLDASSATVTSGTTTSTGETTLSFSPSAGTYVVVADEPTGYHARDDKDGGASQVGGPACNNVYLCIYLTVTEVRNADGTTSFTVELTHVTPDQRSDLDDLWFEMTPPIDATGDESAVAVDEPDDDVLIGEPVDTEDTDREDTVDDDNDTTGSEHTEDADTSADRDIDEPERPGLRRVCADVRHEAVPEQDAVSGIWIRGEVYGLPGGFIWVEGPTLNGGEPIEIPVLNGAFESPLGINQYGDHEVTRFELRSEASPAFTDLLPTLIDGPGSIFPVGPGEGPVFADECFDFAPPAGDAADEVTGEAAAEVVEQASPTAEQQQAAVEGQVDEFLIGFVDDHLTGDVDGLLETLHPAVPLAFGESVCSEYVARTAGSIVGAETISVGLPTSVDVDTPNGVITFPEAIPFTVEFSLSDGSTMTNEANLAIHEGSSYWLTRCGVG